MPVARACPSCCSSLVEFSHLAGGVACCKACGWSGSSQDLVMTVQADEFAVDNAARTLGKDIQGFMDANVKSVLHILVKNGFLPLEGSSQEVTALAKKYGKNITAAILQSIVDTKASQEKERAAAIRASGS